MASADGLAQVFATPIRIWSASLETPPEGRADNRGRDGVFTPPLPPNRTGGFPASGSPVGDFPPCHIADLLMRDWLASPRLRLLGRSVQVPRSSYWYISDGQVAPCPCVRFVVSGYSAIAFVSSRPWLRMCSLGRLENTAPIPLVFGSVAERFRSGSFPRSFRFPLAVFP